MNNAIISEVQSSAYKDGVKEGIEIARQMLCKSLGKEVLSFGQAVAHVDILMLKVEQYEKNLVD
jgi:hypothetical protein